MPPLPEATPEALAHSQRLVALIRAEIAAAGGWLPFSRYMALALMAPGLGYYAAGAHKFGAAGDFVTAPEITPLFGRALARQAAQVLEATDGDLLELGPGSGRLALDLLLELQRLGHLPGRYLLLEPSADLRQRQQALFHDHAPYLLPRLAWLDALPERFTGLVLGNEVFDALPVHLLHWTPEGVFERGVAMDAEGGFCWQDRPLDAGPLYEAAAAIAAPADYLSEVCLAAPALIASLAERLERGLLLFLDYGFPHAEYYHPQRSRGTLMCHYRHHAHDDPFWLPGLNDLTAHVDFTAVAHAGTASGLDLQGYTGQARFLLNCGLLDLMQGMQPGTTDYFRAAGAVQKLLSPAEMGDLFKAVALGRGMGEGLLGFVDGDRSDRLLD